MGSPPLSLTSLRGSAEPCESRSGWSPHAAQLGRRSNMLVQVTGSKDENEPAAVFGELGLEIGFSSGSRLAVHGCTRQSRIWAGQGEFSKKRDGQKAAAPLMLQACVIATAFSFSIRTKGGSRCYSALFLLTRNRSTQMYSRGKLELECMVLRSTPRGKAAGVACVTLAGHPCAPDRKKKGLWDVCLAQKHESTCTTPGQPCANTAARRIDPSFMSA